MILLKILIWRTIECLSLHLFRVTLTALFSYPLKREREVKMTPGESSLVLYVLHVPPPHSLKKKKKERNGHSVRKIKKASATPLSYFVCCTKKHVLSSGVATESPSRTL